MQMQIQIQTARGISNTKVSQVLSISHGEPDEGCVLSAYELNLNALFTSLKCQIRVLDKGETRTRWNRYLRPAEYEMP